MLLLVNLNCARLNELIFTKCFFKMQNQIKFPTNFIL